MPHHLFLQNFMIEYYIIVLTILLLILILEWEEYEIKDTYYIIILFDRKF